MPQLLFSRAKNFLVRPVWLHFYGYAVGYLQPEALDGRPLHGMVGNQAHLPHSDLMEDLRADAVIARVHPGMADDLGVRLDRILIPLIHQAVRAKLVHEA